MRWTVYRPLIGPAVLAVLGFAAYATAPQFAAWLGLEPGGVAAGALRGLTGAWAWLALAWAVARLFDALLHGKASATVRHPRLLTDLLRAALFAAAGVAILVLVFEWPATGLIATSSVVIAVIGFALRNIIGDVFSGIALGIDHPYRIGDWIETAEGAAGRVVEISWRATRLVGRDGAAVTVPNGMIAVHRLVNYGSAGYRITLRVPLDARLPVERAKRILMAGAFDAARRFPGLAPEAQLLEYADGAAVYGLRVTVPDYGAEAACRDAVASAVLRALHHAGLGVARPARDLALGRAGPSAARPRREILLRGIDLFRAFDDAERAELAGRMEERFYPRGAVVVRRGEPGRSLYLLVEGALDVRIARDGAGGAEITVDRMVPGDVFGEMSLLTGQPRSATVAAATDAVVHEIGKEALDPILQRRPEVAERLAEVMAERQTANAERLRAAERPREDAASPTRDDLLSRLRTFFHLG